MERACIRGFLTFLFLVSVLFTFCTLKDYLYMWIFWCIVVGSMLLIDFLFMGRNAFVYDPFYDNWVQQTGPKY